MSILVSRLRPKRRAERTSVREVCLVGLAAHPAPADWASGARVTLSGRTYRVAGTQTAESGTGDTPNYVHLAIEGRGMTGAISRLRFQI